MGLLGELPGHSPIYGIARSNIAPRMTRQNWRSKAVARVHGGGPLYVWIRYVDDEDGKSMEYAVIVSDLGDCQCSYGASFRTLRAALAYANGEDGGRLAVESTLATPEQYPPDRPATSFITTLGFRR